MAAAGTELWRFTTEGVGSGPTVVDGRVYVDSFGSHVYAVEPPSDATQSLLARLRNRLGLGWSWGTEHWRFHTGGGIVPSSPAVADRVVYIAGSSRLHALSTAAGAVQWRFSPESSATATPVGVTVADGTVYVTDDTGTLSAVEAADGTERWHHRTGEYCQTPPVAVGDTVFVVSRAGAGAGALSAVDAADGTERWQIELEDYEEPPTVADGTVYVSHSTTTAAVDAVDGTELWSVALDGRGSTPTVADDTVYVVTAVPPPDSNVSHSGVDRINERYGEPNFSSVDRRYPHLLALDAATGEERWRYRTDNRHPVAPTVAADVVYRENEASASGLDPEGEADT